MHSQKKQSYSGTAQHRNNFKTYFLCPLKPFSVIVEAFQLAQKQWEHRTLQCALWAVEGFIDVFEVVVRSICHCVLFLYANGSSELHKRTPLTDNQCMKPGKELQD